jgi:hypothetical protein
MADIERFALIIGAMKSGTTSLFEYLCEHPQVARSQMKEPAFFRRMSRWKKGWAWYEKLWDWNPDVHEIALEASTAYTRAPGFEGIPARIATGMDQREFKFIYVMRDPLERIESQYNHGVCDGWYDPPPTSDDPIPLDDRLIDPSRYAFQLDQYMEFFSPEDFFLVTFEELRDEPTRVVEDIVRFLGLDDTYRFTTLEHRYNASQGRRKKLRAWTRFKKTKVGFFLVNYLAMRFLPRRLRHLGRRVFEREAVTEPFQLSPAQRQALSDDLSADIRRLANNYGVDIHRWPTARTQ